MNTLLFISSIIGIILTLITILLWNPKTPIFFICFSSFIISLIIFLYILFKYIVHKCMTFTQIQPELPTTIDFHNIEILKQKKIHNYPQLDYNNKTIGFV